MWKADVQRKIKEYGQLYSAWEGSGRSQVVCLLDPPRNALPPQSYQQAQRNLYEMFERIPGKEALVVGLQQDFWNEVRSTNYRVSDDYLDNGGFGVVYGLSKSSPRPDAVELESATFLTEYKRLEDEAIGFMSRSAPFFQVIAKAYREGTENKYSHELQGFLSLAASYRRDHSIELREYVLKLLQRARLLGINVSAVRYKAILVFESIGRLEPQVQEQKQKKTGEVAQPLAEMALLMSQPETIERRAVWQLYRYLLQAPQGMATARKLDETAEAEIERIDEMLEQDRLPAPPGEIIEKAGRLVKERCLTDVLLVRPGEDKQDTLGEQGAMITNLMELAAVLDIAPNSFSWLSNYMHYLYFYQRLKTMSGGMEARVLSDSLAHLEREIAERLAVSPSGQVLVEMEPAIQFMEALGRYHILHGEEWRRVVMKFEAVEMCSKLSELGLGLPQQWQIEAQRLDQEFVCVRDFCDLTVARGKDLASSICSSMTERNLDKGVLYCDAFLYENLARWFQSHNVSYSLLFPRFSVS